METAYADLATKIIALAQSKIPTRILVGVAGPPGSGKSTLVQNVVALINAKSEDRGHTLSAVGVSLDGFHYTRARLDTFSEPSEAHKRRGAPWTFDLDAIMGFVESLQASKIPQARRRTILAPSFDHAVKDPVVNEIQVPVRADIVILDGNYLLLDEDGWRTLSRALDFRVFIDVDHHVARARVANRHVLAGIEPTLELGEKRFDSNDGPNGEVIRRKRLDHEFAVESKPM